MCKKDTKKSKVQKAMEVNITDININQITVESQVNEPEKTQELNFHGTLKDLDMVGDKEEHKGDDLEDTA